VIPPPSRHFSRRDTLVLGAALGSAFALPAAAQADFHALAPRPPMGLNSWDSFATAIDEGQALEVAAIMAEKLKPHGYDVFTIDAQWFEPGANSYTYRDKPPLVMDGHARLMPAVNRFPSAAGGAGFRPLAERVHAMGLRFGHHLMRGIPRQAVERDLPILGASKGGRPITARDIADVNSVCAWNADNYGVDMSKPGAQAYYDSVYRLLASWGVDFVKVDDMSRPYAEHRPEIEAVRRAIDRCGRPMVLSLSPGETPLAAADHVRAHVNMWRVSDDFWDHWPLLRDQFARLAAWAPLKVPGAWPDADMLPLGLLDQGRRQTNFTPDEQRTLMTLWCVAQSPLIMGGDLRHLDPATLDLLTNDEVLAVNQRAHGARQLYARDGLVAWMSRPQRGGGVNLALFNTRDRRDADPAEGLPVQAPLSELGLSGAVKARDLWRKADLGSVARDWAPTVPWHGASLFHLSRSGAARS